MTTELVKSVSIENMVNQRDAVVSRLRQALDLIGEAEKLAEKANIGFPRMQIENPYNAGRITITGKYASRADVENNILYLVDAPAWQYLLGESGLRTFMDATARDKWDRQIIEGDIPALTLETVRGTFSMLYDARAEMFERGVI